MARGKFIVIEGLDGAGITTQTEYLRTWCQEHGIAVAVTKEPTDGPSGAIIKWVLRHELTGIPEESLALLFAADRAHHVSNEIEPALEKGTTVISDRYSLSSFAYQLLRVKDLNWLRAINDKVPSSDLTLFLDVPAEDCLDRMTSDAWRGFDKLQRYEELSQLTQIRENFLSIISMLKDEGENIVILDGGHDIRTIGRSLADEVGKIVRRGKGRPKDDENSGDRQVAALIEKPLLG